MHRFHDFSSPYKQRFFLLLWWWPCGTGSNVVKKGEKKGSAWTMRRGRGADRSTTRHAAKRMSRCTGFFFSGVFFVASLLLHCLCTERILSFAFALFLLFVAYRALLDVVLFLLYCRALVLYIYIYMHILLMGVFPFLPHFFLAFLLLFFVCCFGPALYARVVAARGPSSDLPRPVSSPSPSFSPPSSPPPVLVDLSTHIHKISIQE